MKKLSSYQRLKEKNDELKEEIRILNQNLRTLTVRPESPEANMIKKNVKLRIDIENSLWFGDQKGIPCSPALFNGLFPQINQAQGDAETNPQRFINRTLSTEEPEKDEES